MSTIHSEKARAGLKNYEVSSGNVFRDLGLKDADKELVKAKLALQIYRLLNARKLTQAAAAKLLGTTQPQVSLLMRLKPASVSVDKLMEFLTILGQDIEISVKRSAKKKTGHVTVVLEAQPPYAAAPITRVRLPVAG